MPRLSLYRPEKGNDYKFIDKNIWEMFQVGGTDVFIHKYIGPGESGTDTPATPQNTGAIPELGIQDLLFLENRDRKYEQDVYVLRGLYRIQDIDFNLSQFGLFLQNDTIFITFHINDTAEKLGRKIMAGDVVELPHLKDDFALNDLTFALKRFYVVEEVNRAAEGFSVTWYPHLYRAKCKPLVDSQEFKEILDKAAVDCDGNETNSSLRDIVSTYEKEMQITQAILDQADADAPKSGFDTSKYYHVRRGKDGQPEIVSADNTHIDASVQTQATDENENLLFDNDGNPIYVGTTSSTTNVSVDAKLYPGYLVEDAIPPNGAAFTAGIAFPSGPVEGQFCLRKDYMPNRLFRFDGRRWIKIEDELRHTLTNLGESDIGTGDRYEGRDNRQTQKTTFINNTSETTVNGKTVKEKQSLSKALRPKAD